ncbi:MAG: NAD(P)H-dependent oxidoreductase [Patescibacteria group bacterium]
MNVLITNAHLNYPNWSEGTLNKSMIEVAKDYFVEQGHEVTETNIEDGYIPDEEVQKHVDADLVILQTPINWFGAPWIYKKYVDEVFNSGLHSKILLDNDGRTRSDPARQYGTGGHMLGKKFMVAATWNAPTETFDNPDSVLFEGSSVDDLLLNITSNYKFVGYSVLKSYGIHDIFKDTADIPAGLAGYREYLGSIS